MIDPCSFAPLAWIELRSVGGAKCPILLRLADELVLIAGHRPWARSHLAVQEPESVPTSLDEVSKDRLLPERLTSFEAMQPLN